MQIHQRHVLHSFHVHKNLKVLASDQFFRDAIGTPIGKTNANEINELQKTNMLLPCVLPEPFCFHINTVSLWVHRDSWEWCANDLKSNWSMHFKIGNRELFNAPVMFMPEITPKDPIKFLGQDAFWSGDFNVMHVGEDRIEPWFIERGEHFEATMECNNNSTLKMLNKVLHWGIMLHGVLIADAAIKKDGDKYQGVIKN